MGGYRVVRRLGEGGAGRTWLAEHLLLRRPAVLKQALPGDAAARAALAREAAALWDVRHWALPALRDVLEHDGELVLVSSYIEGVELARRVRERGPLAPEDACWVAERALAALAYLHFRGIVHRDVKPTNLIIDEATHEAALVDLGLAADREGARAGSAGHTPGFAPPEQVLGRPALPESDLFALGATVVWALGGDIASREAPASTPAPVRAWLASLTRGRFEERPRSAEAALATLRAARREAFGRERTR